ncbi:18S rRNA maturation protein [Microbotryomycetes sp. JL221]|nr:18S rRNA maturation protein [Microbotryomycetes sp. JL221]
MDRATRGARGASRGRGAAPRGRGRHAGSAQTLTAGPSSNTPDTIPSGSVSKLKSQLRQTKRLLARDDLTPDVRTTTTRRLELLEQELDKAQHSQQERKMVLKYKGVRFFERQKLLRKIKQAKRALQDKPNDPALQQTLLNLRVDLAYVIRYPKMEKYIALFPEGEYVSHQPPATVSSTSTSGTIVEDNSASSAKRRWQMRQQYKRQMKDQLVGDAVEDGDLGIDDQQDHQQGESEDEGDDDKDKAIAKQTSVKANGKQKRQRTSDEVVGDRPVKKDKRSDSTSATSAKMAPEVSAKTQPTTTPAAAVNETGTVAHVESKELTRKEKKALKDARRREQKRQKAEADATNAEPANITGPEAQRKSIVTKKTESTNVKATLADEDDFFA